MLVRLQNKHNAVANPADAMSRESASPKVQLDWRLEALLQYGGSLTKDRSASRNSNEAEKVFEFVSIDDGAAQFQKRYDKTKSPEENAKSLIAAVSECFVEKPNKTEEAEGLVIEGGAAVVRARLETRLASKVAQKPAATPYAARLTVLEDLYEATKDSSLEDIVLDPGSGLAPPVVGASCRIAATGRQGKIAALKGTNRVVVDLDENEGDDGDAFEQVTTYLGQLTDFNPPRFPIDNWKARFEEANVPLTLPQGKKPKTKKWSEYAKACAKAALDAHKATADKDSAAARDADAKALRDLARSYYCAVADETEVLVLEVLDAFKGDQGAIGEWLAPCAARAALKSSSNGRERGLQSVLVGGKKKAVKKSLWSRRRSKLGMVRKGPTGNERAPRNLYYQYVYQLYRAGNLDPACPFERLTGLKKDAENPPSFFL